MQTAAPTKPKHKVRIHEGATAPTKPKHKVRVHEGATNLRVCVCVSVTRCHALPPNFTTVLKLYKIC